MAWLDWIRSLGQRAKAGARSFGGEIAEDLSGVGEAGASIMSKLRALIGGPPAPGMPDEVRDRPPPPSAGGPASTPTSSPSPPSTTGGPATVTPPAKPQAPQPPPLTSLQSWQQFTNTAPQPPVQPPPLPQQQGNGPLTFRQQLLQSTGQQLMGGGSFSQIGSTVGGLAGGPEGYIIGGVIGGLADMPKKLKDFGDALLEARRPLEEFSGDVGAVYARLTADRIGRSIQSGQAQAASIGRLAEAQSKLEDKIRPYQDAFSNAMADFWANELEGGLAIIKLLEASKVGSTLERIGLALAKAAKLLGLEKPGGLRPGTDSSLLNDAVAKLAAIPLTLRKKPPTTRATY